MPTENESESRPDPDAKIGGWAIAAIGVVLMAAIVADHFLRVHEMWLFELVELGLSTTLVYGGYRLAYSDIDSKKLLTVNAWCLAGVAILGVAAATAAFVEVVRVGDLTGGHSKVRTVVTSGAVLGFVIGTASVLGSVRTSPPTPDALDADARSISNDDVPSAAFDTWLELLSDERCRRILELAVASPDGVMATDELASRLADRSDAGRERTSVHLHHVALPKLTDSGLVDYDDRTETIRYRSNPTFEAVFETTERYRR
ncbi:DUF7344 domain-containing protein [Haladaptatus salinisoli]|uniref:DUF7344 domain-containing protein n=1 Tax=Haladaptatus salinisoli TaxID=2884876 RepID=UPI001D0A0B1A|nr:hypothetical protein [Haladaptatus salinisoli]